MIGVLSDAHGNVEAFRLAIRHLRNLGVGAFYFLGDAVGYIPSLEVVDELQATGGAMQCILGNHELMLLNGSSNPNSEPVYQHQQVRDTISPQQTNFLESWSTHRRESISGVEVLFVHASPNDFSHEYVYPDSDLSVFQPGADMVFMGHSHRPFIRECNGINYVNVGSCGLPRDDGRYGSAAIYDPINGEVRVVRFDITAETKAAVTGTPIIHPAVHDVLTRRSESIFGDFV